MTRDISAPSWTLLELTGMGIVPYSTRGARQSLTPIRQSGANGFRDVNGIWRPIAAPQFDLYASTITCTDQKPMAMDGVWPGKLVTVKCIHELAYLTSGGSPARPVVSGSSYTVGDWTIYCPELSMVVLSLSSEFDEYESEVSWTMQLEEVGS